MLSAYNSGSHGGDEPPLPDDDAETWLAILRASGRSPATLKQYRYVIRPLAEWLAPRRLVEMTRLDAARWMEQANAAWTPGGMYTRLKVWRAFCNWAVAEGLIERSPFVGLSIREPEEVQRTCTDAQLDAMLDGADRQQRAVILCLADTGMRKAECAGLAFGDVCVRSGTIHIRHSKTRPRVVPMSDILVLAMSR
jgi:site-specific recombinase XerD